MARDRVFRLKVTFLDDGSESVYHLAAETDWGVVCEGALIEIRDISGLKAYYPPHAVWMEIG